MLEKVFIKRDLNKYCDCTLNCYVAEVELDNGEVGGVGKDLVFKYSEMNKEEWISWLYSFKIVKLDGGAYVPISRIVKIFNVRKLDSLEQVVHINTDLPTSIIELQKDEDEYNLLLEKLRK